MKVSRRQCVGMIGASVALVPTIAAAAPAQKCARGTLMATASEPEELSTPVPSASTLLSPLVVGSQIGPWRVEGMGALHAGAISVQLSGTDGQLFFVDICARDHNHGAPTAPARTDLCDLFVANEGSGHDPTIEDQGLAAMALAEVVRSNEHSVDTTSMLTLSARLEYHGSSVVRKCVEG